MSTEAAAGGHDVAPTVAGGWLARLSRRLGWTHDQRTARILRYAFGITAAVLLSFTFAWPLFFLTPVLAAVLLGMPLPGPGLRQVGRLLTDLIAAVFLGLAFTLFLSPYPLVYIPLLGLVLFQIYYSLNRGGSLWRVLMALIAVLILPLLGNSGDGLPMAFAGWFAWSGGLAIVCYLLAHTLFPDPPSTAPRPVKKPPVRGYVPAAADAALRSTLVILPLAVVFIALNWASQALVLVMVAVFTLMPDLTKSRAAGIKSLTSTLIGGLTALLVYWLIVAVPELHFFALVMLVVMLSFASAIFSGGPRAAYMGSAATTVIVLIGSLMGDDASFTDVFVTRVSLIGAATVYVVLALGLMQRLRVSPGGGGCCS